MDHYEFLPVAVSLTFKAPTSQSGQIHSNNSPTNCLSLFDHFVGLVLKELIH